jgi:hypothetical protein
VGVSLQIQGRPGSTGNGSKFEPAGMIWRMFFRSGPAEQPLSGATANSQSRPIPVAHGSQLQGDLMINAAILERPVIEKVHTRLGLQARSPPRSTSTDGSDHLITAPAPRKVRLSNISPASAGSRVRGGLRR